MKPVISRPWIVESPAVTSNPLPVLLGAGGPWIVTRGEPAYPGCVIPFTTTGSLIWGSEEFSAMTSCPDGRLNPIVSTPGSEFDSLMASRRLQWKESHEPKLKSSFVLTVKVDPGADACTGAIANNGSRNAAHTESTSIRRLVIGAPLGYMAPDCSPFSRVVRTEN